VDYEVFDFEEKTIDKKSVHQFNFKENNLDLQPNKVFDCDRTYSYKHGDVNLQVKEEIK